MTTITGFPKKPRGRRKGASKWHLVTNHMNMLYMLAADMVMCPAGFRGKHYSDSLNISPGWIPLFRDTVKIPDEVVNHATAERKHLLPCIASFDLSALSGPVRMLSRDGETRNVSSIAARKRKDDIGILIRAPLPMALLSSISFRSSEDKRAFEDAANNVSNVDLSYRRVEVSESMFATDTVLSWLRGPIQAEATNDDNFPAFGQALGGAFGMLYQLANRSDHGLAAFRLATGCAQAEEKDIARSDPILAELPNWVEGAEISSQADTRARLFWGVVQSLVTAQTHERRQSPVDVALEHLESQLELLHEIEFKPRLERLIADMRDCLGLGGGTITELLERHKGSLSRPLLLFCLREDCTDLLGFSHPLLTDAEYVVAGILFGVRDGWMHFPKELRDPGISEYVAYRMADAEHRSQGDDFTLGTPPRPKPLRELFTSVGGKWNDRQKDLALQIARKCNWGDCIQTRITLAEGDYPHDFKRKDLQILLPGRVTAVAEEVIMAAFLCRLGQWAFVDPKIKSEVRDILIDVQEL